MDIRQPKTENPDTADAHTLRAEQVRLLYATAPAALAGTLVCVATLGAVEWDVSPRGPLLAWLTFMAVVMALRYALVRLFQQASIERQADPLWQRLFLAGTALAGLGWGSTMPFLWPTASVPHQVFLVFMLGGITAGATSALSARFEAFACLVSPIAVSVTAHFFLSSESLSAAMATMLLFYTAVMVAIATRIHETTTRSLSLQFENAGLLEQTAAQARQQQQAAEALRRSEERFRALYDDVPAMYFTIAPDGAVLSVNRFGAEYLDYTPDELIGGPVSVVIHPDDWTTVREQLTAALRQPDRLAHWEFRKVRKDGSLLWVKETVRIVERPDGAVALIVCEDITRRKQAEERLTATMQHLETLIETSPLAIISLDGTGERVTRWNRGAEAMFGWAAEEVLGRPLPVIPPGLEDESETLWEQALRDGFLRGVELQRQRKDGRLVTISLWGAAVKDAQGRMIDAFSIIEDITERKRVATALQHSERALRRALKEREQLSRNLHDNIIQSIYAIGFTLEECQRLVARVPEDAERKMQQVIAALNRVIREVRGYLAPPAEESETLSAAELTASLENLGGLMEQANGIRFHFSIDPVATDTLTPAQRAQVLYVAQEAMSNSLRHSGAALTRVSLIRTPGGVRLEICDNGIGFALQQIGRAAGGLQNIHARAQKIGAHLDIRSQQALGTVISMEVPRESYAHTRKI
jgi:PAS domain S-box-containing protein